jgi:hypothetical protein
MTVLNNVIVVPYTYIILTFTAVVCLSVPNFPFTTPKPLREGFYKTCRTEQLGMRLNSIILKSDELSSFPATTYFHHFHHIDELSSFFVSVVIFTTPVKYNQI